MALKLSRSAFKRLCLLPLLLAFLIVFLYKSIANIYQGVEYTGNITTVQTAFDLFNREPLEVCHNIDLLNVGDPQGIELNSYPQLICTDPGFQIEENNCLFYVIKTIKGDWSLEETAEKMGCQVYSLLLAPSDSPEEEFTPARNQSRHIHIFRLGENENVGKFVQQHQNNNMSQHNNATTIDYMMIRLGSGQSEWQILADLTERNQLDRIKHLSVGVNLCPDRSSFTESHFQYVMDVDRQLSDRWDLKLFDLSNDEDTFVYNPVVKAKTYCASQFAWINQRFRRIDDPQYQLPGNDSQQHTEPVTSPDLLLLSTNQ